MHRKLNCSSFFNHPRPTLEAKLNKLFVCHCRPTFSIVGSVVGIFFGFCMKMHVFKYKKNSIFFFFLWKMSKKYFESAPFSLVGRQSQTNTFLFLARYTVLCRWDNFFSRNIPNEFHMSINVPQGVTHWYTVMSTLCSPWKSVQNWYWTNPAHTFSESLPLYNETFSLEKPTHHLENV